MPRAQQWRRNKREDGLAILRAIASIRNDDREIRWIGNCDDLKLAIIRRTRAEIDKDVVPGIKAMGQGRSDGHIGAAANIEPTARKFGEHAGTARRERVGRFNGEASRVASADDLVNAIRRSVIDEP